MSLSDELSVRDVTSSAMICRKKLSDELSVRNLARVRACFFKSPEGIEEDEFFKQVELLVEDLEAKRADRPSRSPRTKGYDRRRN